MMLLRDIVQRNLSTKNYIFEWDVWGKRMSKESLPVASWSGCGRVVLWPFIGWLLTSTQENVTQDENVACSASPLQQSTIVHFTVYFQKKSLILDLLNRHAGSATSSFERAAHQEKISTFRYTRQLTVTVYVFVPLCNIVMEIGLLF